MSTTAGGRIVGTALVVAGLVLVGCAGGNVGVQDAALTKVRQIPDEAWASLAGKRIYFGHQSVGAEVMDGVAKLAAARGGPPLHVTPFKDFAEPGFTHALNGTNKAPLTKIEAFRQFVSGPEAASADIAFFKFCYVDIKRDTDVGALFESYRKTMAELRTQFPKVTFVHVTTPLTTVQSGWKVLVKKVLRKPQYDWMENARRAEFNEKIRNEYVGREPVFDIATVESTLADGSMTTFTLEGRTFPSLVPAYSYDGRHLDDDGRVWVAAHLLETLAGIHD